MNEIFDWTNGVVAIIDGDRWPVGTGFAVSADGLIVTCAHVLQQAGWLYGSWDSPVRVRFKVSGRSARAFVLEGCFKSLIDGDTAVLALEEGLPEEAAVLPLAPARGLAGHTVRMWGYPQLGQQGLGGHGEVVAMVPGDSGEKIQIESTNTTRGYSGGPVWDPAWERVVGMILEAPDPKADALGRHPYTNFAAPGESLVKLCPERLALTPPVSLAAEAARHIGGAVQELVDGYTERIFVGRDRYIEALDSWLEDNDSGRKLVTALAGYGKTSLLANWMRRRQAQGDRVAAHFFSNRSDVLRPVANAYKNLLGQLSDTYALYDETMPDESALPARLRTLIERHRQTTGQRLIILLDALDEAEAAFQPAFLPHRLPGGVYLLTSARTGEHEEAGDWPDYVEGWISDGSPLHLDRLPETALAEWLAKAGDGLLIEESSEPAFRKKLAEISDGYPLYLSYLLDDLAAARRAGQPLAMILDKPARGFGDYVARELRRLAKDLGREKEVQAFFVLLAVARYPLLEDEVLELTGLSVFDLAGLPSGLIRWLNTAQVADGSRSYALAHGRLAQEFASALRGMARRKRDELLRWCANWPEHRSAYALRHSAELLCRVERWDELNELAGDEAYALAQQQELPAEPDLPLRAVRLALEAAGEQAQAGLMARYLLQHGRRVLALRRTSPLAALRSWPGSAGLNRAWQLADSHDNERRILWHLLLAWVLTGDGHVEEAGSTLARLRRSPLPTLSSPWGNLAGWLLAQLSRNHAQVTLTLIETILDDGAKVEISRLFLIDKAFALAQKTAGGIGDEVNRAIALREIAAAQARAGEIAGARETAEGIGYAAPLAEALREIAAAQAGEGDMVGAADFFALAQEMAAGGIADAVLKARALSAIAAAQAGVGDMSGSVDSFAQALEMAAGIGVERDKAKALGVIAAAQVEAGDMSGSADSFALALETAGDIGDERSKARALRTIAAAQVEAGYISGATDTLVLALETAGGIGDDSDKQWALSDMAAVQAKAGDFAQALETADETDDEWHKELMLRDIAAAQAKVGDFSAALETAGGIGNEVNRVVALITIATAQAKAGDFGRALETAGGIDDERSKARALGEIAAAQEMVGLSDAAVETVAMALEMADGIGDKWYQAQVLREIAAAQDTVGLHEAAAETFALALEVADDTGDEWLKEWVLGDIAATQAKARDFGRALETAGGIGNEVNRAMAQRHIAAAQANVGDFGGALETTDRIGDEGSKARVLGDIAAAQARAGNLDQALETAVGIGDERSKARALGEIAAAQETAGLSEAAAETFALALETAGGIDDARRKAEALGKIAAAQAKAGLGTRAVWTARQILTGLDQHLPVIALAMARGGDTKSFGQLLLLCANVPEAAMRACGAVAQLYPEQAAEVADVVINHTWE